MFSAITRMRAWLALSALEATAMAALCGGRGFADRHLGQPPGRRAAMRISVMDF
jgi:hypothetical protein